VTNQDAEPFLELIRAMAVALRADLDDPTIELYFRGLQDIPFELVMAAGERLIIGARFFPKVAEWRLAVDAVRDEQRREQARLTAGQQPLLPGAVGDGRCPDCEDTGFRRFDKPCERAGCFGPNTPAEHSHVWTEKCPTCKDKRAKAAEEAKRFARRPWYEED
jgi:hypothetical protein